MKKTLLFILLTFITGAFAQDVNVALRMQQSAEIDQEFEISITVNKADVTGFARLQLDFPDGFSVRAGNTQGATFSFKDNKARFLWMSLPGDRTLNISCKVTAENASGTQYIEGLFSYVLNNETQRATIPSQSIQIGGGTVIADVVKKDDIIPDTREEDRIRQEEERAEADRIAREKRAEADRIARERAEADRIARERAHSSEADKLAREREEADRLARERANAEKLARERTELDRSQTRSQTSSGAKTDFRVQVGASREPLYPGFFSTIDNNISEFNVVRNDCNDNWYRYTIGSFNTVEAAQQLLRRVEQLGYIAFVVAFKDGERTSINEAKRLLNK